MNRDDLTQGENACCPSIAEIEQFSLGNLDSDRYDAVTRHLETCHLCASTIASHAQPVDLLVEYLRLPVEPDPFDETVRNEAIQLVQQIGRTAFEPRCGAPRPHVAPPSTISQYEVLGQIGEGGMGEIYQARHPHLKRIVAIKLMRRGLLENPIAIKRFRREAEAAGRLLHPNIVTTFDAGEDHGLQFLVMEYVEGMDLARLVRSQGPLDVNRAIDYVTQAARGLNFAHREGLVHRDVKPSNLLVDQQHIVKVSDLGLARLERPPGAAPGSIDSLSQSGDLMGTVEFMAPEQAHNVRQADARADVYSLGCTLYFLLTGRSPYSGSTTLKRILAHQETPIPSLCAERSDVPPALDTIFNRMVAKDPAQRFQSMGETLAALEAIPRSNQAQPGGETSLQHPPQQVRTAPALKIATKWWIILTVLAILGICVYFSLHSHDLFGANAKTGDDLFDRHATGLPIVPTIASKAKEAFPDRRAARWAIRTGGRVGVRTVDSNSTVLTSHVAGLPPQPYTLTEINLWKNKIGNPDVSDSELAHLELLTSLERLSLCWTSVSDEGLKYLRGLWSLKYLQLSHTRITDTGLVELQNLIELQNLQIANTQIRGDGLRSLRCTESLSRLTISGCPNLDDAELKCLTNFINLDHLAISTTPISDGIAPVLRALRKLRVLYLHNTRVSDLSLPAIGSLPRLEILTLQHTFITEAGLSHLAPLNNLQSLTLSPKFANSEIVKEFRSQHPACNIEFATGNGS